MLISGIAMQIGRRDLFKLGGLAAALSFLPKGFLEVLAAEQEERDPSVVQVEWEDLPWKIDEKKFERFNQKYTMFSRTGWDPKVQEVAKQTPANMIRNIKEGKISTLLDYAFHSAGWWVVAKTTPHEMDYGDGGLVSWTSDDTSPLFNFSTGPWKANPELEEERKKFKSAMEKNPELMTNIVKKVAKHFGASLVGIAPYDPKWVYSHRVLNPRYHPGVDYKEEPLELPEGTRYVIVMAFEEDYFAMAMSDGGLSMGEQGWGYSQMAITSGAVAEFLRSLGYIGIPSGNDTAITIPYAISAGLGEYSRMGVLITPKYGPRVRLAKVFTDAPLVPDKPIRFGVYEFCSKCKKCAEACPSNAIPYGDPTWDPPTISNIKGVWKWHVDVEKCFEYWCKSGNVGCGVCIRSCPFNKIDWPAHSMFRDCLAPIIGGGTGRALDDFLGYGERVYSHQWWGFRYKDLVK